jgi:hypothetical protein
MTQNRDPSIEALLRLSRNDEEVLDCDVAPAILGFHAQQAIEKALKALLTHLGIPYGRTHDLQSLESLVNKAGLQLPPMPATLDDMSNYAVIYRNQDSAPDLALDRDKLRRTVAAILTFVGKEIEKP